MPAVFDPEEAMRPGAPLLHDKPASSRIADPKRNIVAELHRHVGDIEAGFAEADVVHEGVYATQRVQHAHLETHGAIGWLDAGGRLCIRTSSQTPFLTRNALWALFDLPRDRVRVFAERVGGGFGGKQEMITEDIVALAVLKTGRPVKLEFTRQEQFTASTSRHPMRVTVKVGARRDGRLTAISLRMLSNTGAYGNHGPGVLFHGSRRVGGALSVSQQEDRWLRRLYAHDAERRLSRLWPEPDQFRDRIGDGRAGAEARHGSLRVQASQRRAAGRCAGLRR